MVSRMAELWAWASERAPLATRGPGASRGRPKLTEPTALGRQPAERPPSKRATTARGPLGPPT
eukprot:5937644-Lingulodinium_polyedra.AAC.1